MHFQEFCYKLIWFASRTKEQSVIVLSHSLQGNIYRKSSVMPPEDRLIYFKHIWRGGRGQVGGLIEIGGLFETGFFKFNLAKTVVSVLLKELEYKVEKLEYKKLEVMQPRIRIKSELPVGKYSLVKNNKGEGRGRRGGEREGLLTFFPEKRVLIRERGLIWEWAWGFKVSLMQQAKSYLRYMSLGKISNCIWIRLPNDLKSSAVYALI